MEKDIKNLVISTFLGMTVFIMLDLFFIMLNFRNVVYHCGLEFTILLSIILYSLFFAILKKSSKSLKTCYIIIFLISIINQIKISITDEPLYLSDAQFLTKIWKLLKLVTTNINYKIIFPFLLMSFFYGTILFTLYKIGCGNEITINNKNARIFIIIVDLVLLIILFIPTEFTQKVFLKIFLNNDKFVDYNGYGTNIHYCNYYGYTAGIYGIHLNNYFFEPENYDDKLLNSELKKTENIEKTNKIGKPNIIVVFSESFWDVDQLDEVKFNIEVTPNFNKLKQQGEFVNLIAPSYGGMSENVVFELLTGASMNYFSQGYIPITSLYKRKNSSDMPSLVKVLKDNGYKTKTTFVDDYYETEKSYKKMGFDEYVELSSDYENEYYYDYDVNLTGIIIDDLTKNFFANNESEKIFNIYSTFENHMPYNEDKYKNYDVDIEQSDLSEEDNKTLRSYAQGIHDSDIALGILYKYVQNLKKDTMVIFLSDHLPYLNNSNYKNLINELEYFNTSDKKVNLYRKYNTQGLVFANYDLKDFKLPEYMGVDLLLNRIVNNMDLEVPAYYKWLDNTYNNLAGSNKYVAIDYTGQIYFTSDLSGNMKKMYDLKNQMQYKLFIK